ncbi:MAG: DUF4919 domain-containing protein [Deltaproteobacteria bacterium]|nr:DUF4919 domain-containing protein [Deltaproteobacteria bacterium]
MNFKILFIISALLVMVFAINPGDAASQEKQSYEALMARVKSGDPVADFKALRIAYTETSLYNPYGGDNEARQSMFDALENKQFEKAIEQATAILDKNYVDIDAHFVCRIAYREMKNMEKSRDHHLMTKGLIDSILHSGDGTAPETAFIVINTREEYILLNVLGFKAQKQSLIESNGRRYDRMEATDLKTNQRVEIYFNVDFPYNWLSKKMKK